MAQAGRPRRSEQTDVMEVPTPKVSTPKVKRQEDTNKTKIYVINQGGGIIFNLKSQATIVENGKVREIRYCPNEPSIYVDEQNQNSVRSHVIFREGSLVVGPDKPNLADFLDKHPGNTSNGGSIYRLLDTEKKAEVEIDTEFLIHDAVSLIRDKDIQDLLPVAMYLGISVSQKNMEIKRELLAEAKANPKRFIELFDNPVVKSRSIIISAVDFQILNSRADGMYWFDSNRLIVATPVGQDSIEVMTRFCMTDKGASVFSEIEARLEKL